MKKARRLKAKDLRETLGAVRIAAIAELAFAAKLMYETATEIDNPLFAMHGAALLNRAIVLIRGEDKLRELTDGALIDLSKLDGEQLIRNFITEPTTETVQ